jgi:hypothetical protein
VFNLQKKFYGLKENEDCKKNKKIRKGEGNGMEARGGNELCQTGHCKT